MISRLPTPLSAVTAVVAVLVVVLAQPHPALAAPSEPAPEAGSGGSATGLWVVRLQEPPLASYAGDLPGIAATSPRVTGARRLDAAAPASVAYLDHLADRQAALVSRMDRALGRAVAVELTYRTAFNGLAVRVDAGEAAELAALPGVVAVTPDVRLELDTDVSHELIRSAAIWDGETGPDLGTRGEGVVVGMLDSGVNPDHPSFAATDGDGYRHTNPFGSGSYVGVCDPDHPAHEAICNDKLVGAWNFAVGSPHARDDEGHGSHVGSTIAGNRHEAVFPVGNDEYTRTVQGVAPRANIISYKVCASATSCFSTASVAAVDQAIADGVDVLNFSISGPDNPWGNAVDQAFLAAFQAGVFVAASAGNDGPDPGTVAKTAPWNATVAATTHHRLIANRLDVTGPAPVPPELTGLAAVPGDGPALTAPLAAEIRYAGTVDPDNVEGCEPFPPGSFDGAAALIERGACPFRDKVGHATDAGAVGVVVFNQFGGAAFVMGGLADTTIPAVMLDRDGGQRLRDFVTGGPTVQARIGTETALVLNDGWADLVADFSSRGPSQFDLLAPTFAAPGRGILAAGAEVDGDPVRYEFMQGTSMASPHGAGAGALLAALHPEWSPAQIRSALAVTADRTGVVKEDGVTPADPFDVGSGRLDLDRAGRAGLVLDETHENFVAANPAAGGDPKTLNLPAMMEHHCDQVCSWTRELTSVAAVEASYTAQVEAPAGMTVAVAPAEFTLAPGATQRVEITVDVGGLARGDWLFAGVELVTGATHGPDGPPVVGAHLPVAVRPAAPELSVDPTELSSTLDVAEVETHTLTIGNAGGAALSWHATGDGDGCDTAGWYQVMPAAGTVAPFSEQQVEVTFDSTGLDDGGVFEAGLCLASDDPAQPVQVVALALTVVPVPVVDLAPGSLAAEQPAGTVTGQTLAVGNAGHGVLEWTLDDEDAGPSDARLRLLRDGVLLVPNSASASRGVMAFDPYDGHLIDPEFIPHVAFDPSTSLYTPGHILPKPDGTGFLMADQLRWVITEHDLAGNFRGVFAPVSGERDPEVMANIRGMAWSPWGTLLVTVAAQANVNSVVELDADGNFLGTFIDPGQDGLDSPWYILFRDDDVLVSASNSDAIHSFSRDGTTANARFADLNWPAQMVELDDGNILTVNWSGTGGAGVREFDRDGNLVGAHVAAGSSYAGVHPLGNGNILTTTSTGVYEIDRAGEVFETEFAGGRARYVTEVRMPDAQPCATPAEVPWLSVSPGTGGTGAGETTELTVRLDSTGLEPGTHRAQLCLTSNDPETPLLTVPVTLTVTGPGCDATVTGTHPGALVVTSGLTCLGYGAEVTGPVTVRPGASLFASGATVRGPVLSYGAATVTLDGVSVTGPVYLSGTTGALVLSGSRLTGAVSLVGNTTGQVPIVVSGNRITGPLSCLGNAPPPVDDGDANVVTGPTLGQCAGW